MNKDDVIRSYFNDILSKISLYDMITGQDFYSDAMWSGYVYDWNFYE